MAGSKVREIDFGDDFGEVVFTVNGTRIEIDADGHVAVNAPEIGDEMADGTILAGYYENEPLYATPKDAPGTYTFNEAAKYAKNLDAHGHHDFRLPSDGELNVLYQNRDKGKLKGTFKQTASTRVGTTKTDHYWSSQSANDRSDKTYGLDRVRSRAFSDGVQTNLLIHDLASLRLVRG
jgi:hypothetical protein